MLLLVLFFALPARAATVFEDSFDDRSKVAPETTAEVDTENGLVRLPRRSLPGAMDFWGNDEGVVVADSRGIHFYVPGTSWQLEEVAPYFYPVQDAVGVIAVPGTKAVFAWTEKELFRLDYDGVGMSRNPLFDVTGYNQILSVAVLNDGDSVAVLAKEGTGKRLDLYTMENGTFRMAFSMDVAGDPVAVARAGGPMDVLVGQSSSVELLMWTGSELVPVPERESTAVELRAVRGQGEDRIVLSKDRVEWQMLTEDGYVIAEVLSQSLPSRGIALAVSNERYMYMVADEEGTVRTYRFDGTQMLEDPMWRLTELQFRQVYLYPRIYQSVVIDGGEDTNLARLTVQENHDPGGSVKYELSNDGGATWVTVTPGEWVDMGKLDHRWVVRAELTTTKDTDTPRILHVKLEATRIEIKNLQVVDAAVPAPGTSYPTSSFPLDVLAGSEITFTVETRGLIDRVVASFSDGTVVEMVPEGPAGEDLNRWVGRYTVPVGTPRDTFISVTITASNRFGQKTLVQDPFLRVAGGVFQMADLRLVQ